MCVLSLCYGEGDLQNLIKQDRMRGLVTSRGVIAALAMDQRRSLRRMIAAAARTAPEDIPDAQLSEFKAAVTRVLSPFATAVLLDPEYGLEATRERDRKCGLLLTYESDGYENPRPFKALALMPEYSVYRLRDLGANGVKILLSYTPEENLQANEEKHALIERIVAECTALGLPFFLEPVVYDPSGTDVRSPEFARQKPGLVIRTMQEFSRKRYQVDVLKVEFPVNSNWVDGPVRVFTRAEALAYYRAADETAACPYIYLSAGVSSAEFLGSLRLAAEAGARFSGVLCGRANWQDGIPAFARAGRTALEDWLSVDGVKNIRAVNECLQSATGWDQR